MFFRKKVSICAILSYFCAISFGVAADTTVTSKQYVDNQINTRAAATNKVNGAPLSNENSVFYGTSSTAAATSPKVVSIPAITQLDTGTVIVVKPTITSSKISAGMQLKLNDFTAYPIKWNTNAVGASYYDTVWVANTPRAFIFDGSAWVVSDMNTTYSAMSVAEGQTGTATSSRVVRADYLKQIIQYWANQEDASDLHLPVPTAAGKLLRSVSAANDTFEWAEFTPDYVTSSMLNDYLTTTVAANTYQTKITSDSKLLSDLVDDTNQTHKFVTASEKSTWNAKQNAISDLATIRSGASAGATAVQPGDLADVATSGSYNDLTDKPTMPTDTNTTYTFAEGTTNGAFSVTPSGGSAQSVPVHGWADKEDVINKKNDIDAVWVAELTSAQKATYYPTVGAVHERLKNYALVNDLASKVDKVVAADKKRLISRNKDGLAGPAPSEDVDVADDGSFIVKHAVTADSATTAGSVPWTGVTGAPAIPTDTNTTYTFAEGTTNGAFSVTPSGGSAQSVPVHGWANKQDKITSISTSGTGSVVTAVTASNGTITATKGNVSYNDLTDTPTIPSAPGDIGAQPAGNYVTRSGTTAVGSATQPVYVDANGVATATTYTLGKSVPSDAKFTDTTYSQGTGISISGTTISNSGVRSVTNGAGGTVSSTAVDGSVAVNTNGTTTYPVVKGWANKQDTSTAVTHTASTKVGETNKPVYIAANGAATAINYTINKSVPSDAVFTDSVTTVTKSDGTAGASTAADGSIKVTKDGTTTYPVVQGWANKQDKITSISTSGTGSVVTAVTASNGTITATKGNVSYNDLTDTPTIPSAPGDIGAQPAGNYVTRSGTTAVGSATQPVYVDANGVATATTYTLGKSVPSDAVFTDSVTTVTKSDGTAGASTAADGSIKVTKDGTTTYPVVQGWANKQDKITSISTSGTGNVVTAVTASNGTITVTKGTTLHDVATSGDFDDLTNVPSKLSYFFDDIGAGAAHYYGSGVGAATTATKSVQIDSISLNSSTNLPAVGTVIVVIPATTSNVVNPTLTLKSGTNNGVAKAIKYNNSTSITAVNSGKIWQAGVPSTFVYDGTNWVFAGNGGTYSQGTGISISGTTISNSGVRSVTNGAGGTVSSTAVDGSVAVNTNGTTTYPVVKGWNTKVDVGQGASKANMALYTDSSGNVTPDSVKVPITDSNATGGWSYMWID